MFQENQDIITIFIFIKYVIVFIIVSNIIFNEYFLINIKQKLCIEIDNEFKENLYETDISFNNYQTRLKPIAFYYPEYNNISYIKYFNKTETTYLMNNDEIEKLIKFQAKLAKNHGIYGFAIYSTFINKLKKKKINIFISFYLNNQKYSIRNKTNKNTNFHFSCIIH